MKITSLILFLFLFITSENLIGQDLESKLNNTSSFQPNKEKADNLYAQALDAHNENELELAGDLYVESFLFSSDDKNLLLYNALASFISATKYTKALICYDKLLEGGILLLEEETQFDIHRNVAAIYNIQNESEKVINAIHLARNIVDDDTNLVLTQANHYYKLGDMDNFIVLLSEEHERNPKNFDVNYNLGVIYNEQDNFEKAISYYKKALKIKKNNPSANNNFAALLLSKDTDVVNKMNRLGVSKLDQKKYDLLEKERRGIHKSAIPYLKKVIKVDSDNKEAISTLMKIYENLGYEKKMKELQKL